MDNWDLPSAWESSFETSMSGYDDLFLRSETRDKVKLYVRGILADVERKNGWQLAETLGLPDPHPLQRVLNEAKWEADAVQARQREHVRMTLDEDAGVLVLDESGFPKKGSHSAGVAAQYCGQSGKIDNCQVGVYLTLATRTGTGFLDRRLYLPRAWCEDADRREQAHVPEDITFQTKPEIAQELLAQAWSEGIRSRYVTGDTLYGNSPGLRRFIAAQNRIYVLAIGSHHHADLNGQRQSLPEIARTLSNHDWESIAVTISETGPVWYDWQAVRVTLNKTDTHEQWLLIRRSIHDETSDLDFFVSNAPRDTPLADLVMVASMRHEIEQVFEEAKDQLGLADYEVRTWHGWHRHMTLCFLAHTWLMTLSHAEREKKGTFHAG